MQIIGTTGGQNHSYAWPAGTQVGDIVIGVGVGNNPALLFNCAQLTATSDGTPGQSIFAIEGASGISACWKVLNSGDLAGPPSPSSIPGFGWMRLLIIRDAVAVRIASLGERATGTALSAPGFTKDALSNGLIHWAADRDPAPVSELSAPSGFTTVAGSNEQAQYFCARLSTMTDPSGYTNGAAINSGAIGSSYGARPLVLEAYGFQETPPLPPKDPGDEQYIWNSITGFGATGYANFAKANDPTPYAGGSGYTAAPWQGLYSEFAPADDGHTFCLLDNSGFIFKCENADFPASGMVIEMVQATGSTAGGAQSITHTAEGYCASVTGGSQGGVWYSPSGDAGDWTFYQNPVDSAANIAGAAYVVGGFIWLFRRSQKEWVKLDLNDVAAGWVKTTPGAPVDFPVQEAIYSADLNKFLLFGAGSAPYVAIVDASTNLVESNPPVTFHDGLSTFGGYGRGSGGHWSELLQKWVVPLHSSNNVLLVDLSGAHVYKQKLKNGVDADFLYVQSSDSSADRVFFCGNSNIAMSEDGHTFDLWPTAGVLVGAMALLEGVAPPAFLTANFLGKKGELGATLHNPQAVFADFLGKKGALDSLMVNASDDPPVIEELRLGQATAYVYADWMNFANTPSTHKAIKANFTGKRGFISAELVLLPEIDADFVGKKGQMDALLGRGQFSYINFTGKKGFLSGLLDPSPFIVGEFQGKKGALNSTLVQASQLEAGFVGKKGALTSYYPGLVGKKGYLSSYYPGLVGRKGGMEALLWVGNGLYINFTGKKGALNADLMVAPVIWAGFEGKKGFLNAEIENDYFALTASFVGKKGFLGAVLENPQIDADFVGKKGFLSAELVTPLALYGDFIGKKGYIEGDLLKGLGIDAFFRGKKGYMEAAIEEYVPNPAEIEYTFKKYTVSMTMEGSNNSSLTFILIQP